MKPYWTIRRLAATVRASLVGLCSDELIWVSICTSSVSTSSWQFFSIGNRFVISSAIVGKISSPKSISNVARNWGKAASELKLLRVWRVIRSEGNLKHLASTWAV